MTNGRRLVLAFTFKLGQKQAQLRSAMETVKICSKCVGSTINAGSGFHGSSVLRLFVWCLIRQPRIGAKKVKNDPDNGH